jgi:tetratricopeptide (TPR) repeat protein
MSTPLVSIIVRSMGRPELRHALQSIAAQDYPNIEIIVVDATGGTHPPLPDIAWRPGHRLRRVGGDRRLPRPLACNVGLDAVAGEWFGFLDDDDTYAPHHVSTLVEAARATPDALVVYGLSNILAPDGRVEKVFGAPFNRAMLHYGPLFYWQASLISRRVRDLGCRFDEALDVCEDRDFLHQIAEHGDFVHVPAVTFNYRPDVGTSGTGRGANLDLARLLHFDARLKAKWAGPRAYHMARVTAWVREAIDAYGRGDAALARRGLERALAVYPDDPNALHALARLELEAGAAADAARRVARALEYSPQAAEFHLTHALALEALGRAQDARDAARKAGADPAFRPLAEALLRRLPAAPAPARNAPCPCGSGRRYKHCCGAVDDAPVAPAEPVTPGEDDLAVARARAEFDRGEAFAARALLDAVAPERLAVARAALDGAHICHELGELDREAAYLARALRLGGAAEAERRFAACATLRFADLAWASLRRQAHVLLDRIAARHAALPAGSGRSPRIHVIGDFRAIGGSEHRALELAATLAAAGDVVLWSQSEPLAVHRARHPALRVFDPRSGSLPEDGTLVFVGNWLDLGGWIDAVARCGRVILHVNVADPSHLERVVAFLAAIDDRGLAPRIDLVYPSRSWRERVGLGGVVEYLPVDTRRFTRTTAFDPDRRHLVVGRLARADGAKFHPDDPALVRRIVARGHRVRMMDGTRIAPVLQPESRAGRFDALPLGASDARDFLDTLDVFLYWKHPLWVETGGTVILEAMAMALPVIAFAKDLGVAELIEHGKDGFLVESEREALDWLDMLAAAPGLRRAVGLAARQKILATLARQRDAMLDFYRDPSA